VAFNVSFLIQLQDRFSSQARRIKSQVRGIKDVVKKADIDLKKFSQTLGRVGRGFTLKATLPILALGGFALKSAADLEIMAVSFDVLTGSAKKSAKLTKELIQFSARTPFELPGLADATKKLLAAGVGAEDITNRLKTLGDIAAISGIPLSDLASIFAKIKNKNKAMTEEILQLAERGIPIIDSLSKTYGITGAAVLEAAEKSQISFAIIKKELEKMTSRGGRFENGMEKLSLTLSGVFSTLRDNVRLSLAEIGASLIKAFDIKTVLEDSIKQIQKFTEFFKGLSPEVKKTVFIIFAFVAVLGPLLTMIGFMTIGIFGLSLAIGALSLPVVVLVAAIGLVAAAFVFAFVKSKEFRVMIQLLIGSIFNLVGGAIKGFIGALKVIGRLTEAWLKAFTEGNPSIFFRQIEREALNLLKPILKLKSALDDITNFFKKDQTVKLNVNTNLAEQITKVKKLGKLEEFRALIATGAAPAVAAKQIIKGIPIEPIIIPEAAGAGGIVAPTGGMPQGEVNVAVTIKDQSQNSVLQSTQITTKGNVSAPSRGKLLATE